MKKLLLILLVSFLSSNSLAKVGDVYYCEPNLHIETRYGQVFEEELEPFSFLRKEKVVKFSESFFWADSMPYKLVPGNSSYGQALKEEFQGYDDFTNQQSGGSGGVINFVYTQTGEEGQFSFTLQFSDVVWVIIAECEIL